MISFNQLGNLGRLGNQMFQYAALKGIAKHCGYEFCIPPKENFGIEDKKVKSSDCNIYDTFNNIKSNKIEISSNQRVVEKTYTFDEELFNKCLDDCDLFGYFQSEKYFKHIEDDIKKDFSFDEDLRENCKKFLNEPEYISLHVRRGDYLNIQNYHPVQTCEYYEKSLQILPHDIPVIIFSDDVSWCKSQELFSSDRFLISENNSTDADLCLMTLCDYHIIANSSFSWWGAWLANSKKIIAPKNWFGDDCITKDVRDRKFGNWSWL